VLLLLLLLLVVVRGLRDRWYLWIVLQRWMSPHPPYRLLLLLHLGTKVGTTRDLRMLYVGIRPLLLLLLLLLSQTAAASAAGVLP
jgi:hypothetical protein